MCGIAGIFNFGSPEEPDQELVRRMTAVLAHRGPDDEGVWSDRQVVLGHRRLSIIDLADGRQPLGNEDETVWVAFNGEIYNYMDLRSELRANGHTFATHSDTEVLVHGYEDHGVHFVEHLRGMFALALWDERNGKLVLVRDRFGKKPLYVAEGPDRMAFASEMKALLLLPWVDRTWNASALKAYFALGYIPASLTAYNGIRKVLPGTVEVWSAGEHGPRGLTQSWRYWQPQAGLQEPPPTYEEACRQLASRLRDSVAIRLRSDVPLGAFLSGGVDSTCIVALMRACGAENLKTFSIGFEGERESDLPFAREAASALGTDHYSLVHTAADAELIPKVLELFDEPFADSSALPTYLVSRLARGHVTVALSGDGGDELFAGYSQYTQAARYDVIDRIPHPVQRFLGRVGSRVIPEGAKGGGFVRMLDTAPQDRFVGPQRLRRRALFQGVLGAEVRQFVAEHGSDSEWQWAFAGSPSPTELQVRDQQRYLVDDILVKVDRCSMAVSLEARVPLLDHLLADWVNTLPIGFKLRGGESKAMLRDAIRAHVPGVPESVLRRKKKGFGVPLKWLMGPRAGFAREIIAGAPRGLFDERGLKWLFEADPQSNDHGIVLWYALSLASWAQRQSAVPW